MNSCEYRAMMRRKLLEGIYEKMSDEEKRVFAQLTMQDAGHEDIMAALQGISRQVDNNKYNFGADLLANVTGNAVWDGAIYLFSKLIKAIK